jgi:CheY-like chemotaxis protein
MTETRTYSLLYIEDNEANRLLLQLILERKEYLRLFAASDGQSGIKTARQIVPDIILLDISLPDMNGYAVLAALRKDPATAKIPVIAISGEFPPQIPGDAPYVFEKYLPKPIEIVPLYQAIDELLQL